MESQEFNGGMEFHNWVGVFVIVAGIGWVIYLVVRSWIRRTGSNPHALDSHWWSGNGDSGNGGNGE